MWTKDVQYIKARLILGMNPVKGSLDRTAYLEYLWKKIIFNGKMDGWIDGS